MVTIHGKTKTPGPGQAPRIITIEPPTITGEEGRITLSASPTSTNLGGTDKEISIGEVLAAAVPSARDAYPKLKPFLHSDGSRILIGSKNWRAFEEQLQTPEFKSELAAFAAKMPGASPASSKDTFSTENINQFQNTLQGSKLVNNIAAFDAHEVATKLTKRQYDLSNQGAVTLFAAMFSNLRASVLEETT